MPHSDVDERNCKCCVIIFCSLALALPIKVPLVFILTFHTPLSCCRQLLVYFIPTCLRSLLLSKYEISHNDFYFRLRADKMWGPLLAFLPVRFSVQRSGDRKAGVLTAGLQEISMLLGSGGHEEFKICLGITIQMAIWRNGYKLCFLSSSHLTRVHSVLLANTNEVGALSHPFMACVISAATNLRVLLGFTRIFALILVYPWLVPSIVYF